MLKMFLDKLVRTSKTTPPFIPNLLLTNFCNQQCPYCFAQENMINSSQKEITFENFKFIIQRYRQEGLNEIRFLGGEPTLHTEFIKLVELSTESFNKIWIFTNCLIPKKVDEYIKKTKNHKLVFVVNLDTLSFSDDNRKRQEIIDRIRVYSDFAEIYTGFTISDLEKNYLQIYDDFSRETVSSMRVRFGIAKPILGTQPFLDLMSETEKKLVGRKIITTAKALLKIGVKSVTFDCGLQPTMFTASERAFIERNIILKDWGCQGYWGEFDIDTDLTIIPCFPHSQAQRKKITDFRDFTAIKKEYACKKSCLAS
jgi:sulfatase maturation enzyme AslB (radical SAM superfamily)